MTYEETKYGIGWAIVMMKAGGAVRRTWWPKDTYLNLQGAAVVVVQWRNMDKKIKDLTVKEWTPTSGDLLATDWEAYESEGEGDWCGKATERRQKVVAE